MSVRRAGHVPTSGSPGPNKRQGLALALGLGVPALVAAVWLFASGSVGDYSFSGAQLLVRDEFGPETPVVSIKDSGGDVIFELTTGDGRVTVRSYRNFCDNRFGRTRCSRRTTTTTRATCADELDAAGITLGQLDQDVVEQLRERTRAFKGATVSLRGQAWVVQAGPFRTWIANPDGSDLRVAESDADRALAAATLPGAGARDPAQFGPGGASPLQPQAPGGVCQGLGNGRLRHAPRA